MPHVALINEAMAKDKWPNQNPLGHTIEFGNMDGDFRALTIVGVIGNVRQASLRVATQSHGVCNLSPAATTHGQFFCLCCVTRQTLQLRLHPRERLYRPLIRILRPTSYVGASVFAFCPAVQPDCRAFAGTAFLLAIIGLYGVMSYVVSQRTGEFGIALCSARIQEHSAAGAWHKGLLQFWPGSQWD